MEEKIILGFHKFHSNKKNQDYLVADCSCDVTQRDRANGYFGNTKVEQIFIPEELWDFFDTKNPEKVCGKRVRFEYAVSGRYFNLINLTVIE